MSPLHAVILATEAGGGPAEFLLPHTYELIWGFVGFALLMAIMVKKVFPVLNETLEKRQQAIQGRLAEAEAARQEAERLRRQYEEQLASAREQASRIIEEARAQAERLRQDLVKRAEEEARQIVERARADQRAERNRLLQDLRSQVAVLSLEIAKKVVGSELDAGRHDELVDQYINDLSSLN